MKKLIFLLALLPCLCFSKAYLHHINDGEWYLFTDQESACFSINYLAPIFKEYMPSLLLRFRGIKEDSSNVTNTALVYETIKINGITVDNNIICNDTSPSKNCYFRFNSASSDFIFANKISHNFLLSKTTMPSVYSVQICLLNLDIRKGDINHPLAHNVEAQINTTLPLKTD